MSCNRENVIWKSRDGTWGRGFFSFYDTGDVTSEDYDPEWDVEYEYDSFWWASVGHATSEAAYRSWDGVNPGGYDEYSNPSEMTDRFDRMAATCIEADRAARRSQRTAIFPPPLRFR